MEELKKQLHTYTIFPETVDCRGIGCCGHNSVVWLFTGCSYLNSASLSPNSKYFPLFVKLINS